jgi:hypothetical protein
VRIDRGGGRRYPSGTRRPGLGGGRAAFDSFSGLSREGAHVLENIAALDNDSAYLGAFSIPRVSRPGALYVDAVEHARLQTPRHPSIVNGQIAGAIQGELGNMHSLPLLLGAR